MNSGLYFRPPLEVVERWRRDFRIDGLDTDDLDSIADEVEQAINVTTVPGNPTPASEILRRGAATLGWKHSEIPRWMKYPAGGDAVTGKRQSMTRTYLPRAFAAGARMLVNTRVDKLVSNGLNVTAHVTYGDGTGKMPGGAITAAQVFVCGGAIQTPALLQRSGMRSHIGRTLAVHPTVKLTAKFADEVNVPDDVPVHQVKEFAPDLSFGGSASHSGLVALALTDEWRTFASAIEDWRKMSIYYAAITSEGRGWVQALPGFRDPLVTYRLSHRDREVLRSGLARLALLSLEAGATEVYPSFRGAPVVRNRGDLAVMQDRFAASKASVMTGAPVLHGATRRSIAIGAAPTRGGKVHGHRSTSTGQRRLAATDRAGGQPAGHGDGVRHPQRTPLHRGAADERRTAMTERWAPPAMTVVTGAAGWLGRALVHRLLADGRTNLRVLVHSTDDRSLIPQGDAIAVEVGDIGDRAVVDRLFAGLGSSSESGEVVDVVHTAGIIHPKKVADFFHVNAQGTRNVVAAASAAGVRRLVHVSSNSPFGTNSAPRRIVFRARTSRTTPTTATAARRCSPSRQSSRRSPPMRPRRDSIVRPPWFYGPFQPPRQTTFFRMVRTGQVPGDRRRRAEAPIDGLRRQPRRRGARRRTHTGQRRGHGYWIADARPYTRRPRSSRPSVSALRDEGLSR